MIKWDSCRRIITRKGGANSAETGSILEIIKRGNTTVMYIVTINPGVFKGYHLHQKRTNTFFCLQGELYMTWKINGKMENGVLLSSIPERLIIPPNIPIGVENKGSQDALLICYTEPAFNPDEKDEQISLTREEVEQ